MTIYKRFKSMADNEIDALATLPTGQLAVVTYCFTVGLVATTSCYPFLYQMVGSFYPEPATRNTGMLVGVFISILNGGNALG
ncbi:hypothetical protein SYNPS1DRAFT_25995, partial [Syncephalis pseudoplumigaleata]